eukprot:CAMPEP_0182912628 /NCGR_PEP_ID=MMETSP0034_2-20130328/37617_1 /TAXON_ID=156128 /ORGANISM="Nephroselmis pyriformis, Strain CCMP717" /LENGTH=97 /DNA_ID=CAMNT_0025049307 /DNA_START=127 /DNA_END=418 /DNA_ORIENTATION=-
MPWHAPGPSPRRAPPWGSGSSGPPMPPPAAHRKGQRELEQPHRAGCEVARAGGTRGRGQERWVLAALPVLCLARLPALRVGDVVAAPVWAYVALLPP